MAILAATKHMIISLGTFGWWAAYLRGAHAGETFYYATPFHRPLDYHEHFLPHWTGISDQDIALAPKPADTCEVTLVTSYFDIPSKHSHQDYLHWMPNVLSLNACMVIMASSSSAALFAGRQKTRLVTVELAEAAARINHTQAFWEAQWLQDPEASIHRGHQLYWVWALKALWLGDAAQDNVFSSEYFYWIDIGCLRDRQYWGRTLLSPPVQARRMGILFAEVEPFLSADLQAPVPEAQAKNHLSGACWGGHSSSVLLFKEAYYAVFARMAEAGHFVGKDQTLMNRACIENPGLCHTVRPNPSVYNEWFYMVPFLLGETPQDLPFPLERTLVATMLSDDIPTYAKGAVALIKSIVRDMSLPQSRIDFKLFELDIRPIDPDTKRSLQQAGWVVASMPRIPPREGATPWGRFVDQFSKFNFWAMTQYDRVLYLDSDCLVVGSLGPLLSLSLDDKPLWVTRDIRADRWVDAFNMGVVMIRPSLAEFERLMRLKDDQTFHYETAMAEQGLLNRVYPSGTWGEIGFRNNANLAAYTADRQLWDQAEAEGINVIHYTMNKPWACAWPYLHICALWLSFHT
jgi:hypothetical protein